LPYFLPLLVLLLPATAAPSEALSGQKEFHQALDGLASARSHGLAVGVLIEEEAYTESELAGMFSSYFLELDRPLNRRLYSWLSTTALGEVQESLRNRLQAALAPVLTQRISKLLAEHGARLGTRAATTATLRETVTHTLHLRRDVTIDVRARPMLAAIRAQLYQIMRDVRPLNPGTFIADTGFHGRYVDFLNRYGLLVLDNNCLDGTQLQAIEDLLEAIPASLHNATRISVHDPCLGTPAGEPWWMRIRGGPGVNIAGRRVASVIANQFPGDSEPIELSSFCAVLQHELNHLVNAHAIRKNPSLSRRQAALIERAGTDPRQFLRSQIEESAGHGFFQSAPQEFFASISNQYLASSMQTMELGFERLLQGYPEPLNQFLFFLEVYSLGGTSSLFFSQNDSCHYEVEAVNLERNAQGFIERVVVDEVPYDFVLDRAGNVVPSKLRGADSARSPDLLQVTQ
jgi:hypothetical protein